MELKRALEIRTEFLGIQGSIRVDKDDYICLNEMLAFFPTQRLDKWMEAKKTEEFVKAVEKEYQIPQKEGIRGIITKRGNKGGTWAHPMIAFEFATWLSPEFKLKVYKEYIDGTQNKKDWNITRILSAFNYKMLCVAVKGAHEEPKPYHYSNESLLVNEIVFGERESVNREALNEEDLGKIANVEGWNSCMINMGMEYQERKIKLKELFAKLVTNKLIQGASE